MTATRRGLRAVEIEPLRLLRQLPPAAMVALLAVLALQAVMPVAAALVSGLVVSKVAASSGRGSAGVEIGVAALGITIVLQQAAEVVADPVRTWAARAMDGVFRRRLGDLATSPAGIAHLEDEHVAGALTLASRELQGFTPGKAAVAQAAIICQGFAAVGCVIVLAARAPLWALAALVLTLAQRQVMNRLFVGLNWRWVRSAHLSRRAEYWAQVAAGPAAAKEVRVFGLGGFSVGRYSAAVRELQDPIQQARKRVAVGSVLPALLAATTMIGSLLVLAPHSGSRVPAGTIAAYVAALITLVMFGYGGWDTFEFAHGRPAFDTRRDIEDRLTAAPEDAPRPGSSRTAAENRSPVVRFENVGFRYPNGAQVCAGLDLEIRPGEVLAIVGRNGAGKSTLVKLLARLYEPDAGHITADGVDIATQEADAWRGRLSVVAQSFLRYDFSFERNIEIGAPERLGDHKLAARVVEELGMNELVESLPDGWNTPLSRARTGGTELSGGQWQRVALARGLFALKAERQILVLDEPTAHLDVEAEFEVFRQVKQAAAGASVVLISHRFATVRLADRIAVMDGGRIAEIGNHDELMRAGGLYAHMFRIQAQQFAATSGEVSDGVKP